MIENKLITYELKTSEGEWRFFQRPYSTNLEHCLKFLDSFGKIKNVNIVEEGVLKELEYFPRD